MAPSVRPVAPMKKLSLGLGLLLGAWMAACTASTDDGTSAPEPARDDELNESKALGMTDVTILYPQPDKWEQVDDMLGPSSEDAKGELLPGSLFAQIADLPSPKMIGRDGNEVDPGKKLFAQWADNFAYLRVVGIRLDPCFGETTNLGALVAERVGEDVRRSAEEVTQAGTRFGQLVHRVLFRHACKRKVRQAVRAEAYSLLLQLANTSRVEQTLLAFPRIPRVRATDLTGDEKYRGRHPSRL